MPKINITSTKGLVQSTGLGLVHGSPATISTAAVGAAVAATTLSADPLTIVTVTNDADDRIYLPDPSTLDVGTTIILAHRAAFELSSVGNSISINGTAVTTNVGAFSKEVALGIGITRCTVSSSSNWIVDAAAAPN
jgi:hypothetical protein